MAGELQLALAYELSAANAPRFAADIVAQAASQGVILDFSESTLSWLDSVTASLRASKVTVEQVPEVLFGFGCVLGECVIAASGGSWVDTDFDAPIGVKVGTTTLDPVGYAFATLASGRSYTAFLAGNHGGS
jgi:hypothetical protein